MTYAHKHRLSKHLWMKDVRLCYLDISCNRLFLFLIYFCGFQFTRYVYVGYIFSKGYLLRDVSVKERILIG